MSTDGSDHTDVVFIARVGGCDESQSARETETEYRNSIGARAALQFLRAESDDVDRRRFYVVVREVSHFGRHDQNAVTGERQSEVHQTRFFDPEMMHAVEYDHGGRMRDPDGNVELRLDRTNSRCEGALRNLYRVPAIVGEKTMCFRIADAQQDGPGIDVRVEEDESEYEDRNE